LANLLGGRLAPNQTIIQMKSEMIQWSRNERLHSKGHAAKIQKWNNGH